MSFFQFVPTEPKTSRVINKLGKIQQQKLGKIRQQKFVDLRTKIRTNREHLLFRLLTGGDVSGEEVRGLYTQLQTIVRSGQLTETSKQSIVLLETALASRNDRIYKDNPLSKAFLFRYTMELVKNVHDTFLAESYTKRGLQYMNMIRRLTDRSAGPQFILAIRNIVSIVKRYYKPGEDLRSFKQFACWKALLRANAVPIFNMGHRRVLSLGECQQLDIPNPPVDIVRGNRFRAVNAFAVRLTNTPDSVAMHSPGEDQKNLTNILNTHVNGASERSRKPFSNKSKAISLTGSLERALKYAIFYGQFFPIVMLIEVRSETSLRTTEGLRQGGGTPHNQATNISNAHDEYIPLTVSYIPESTIVSMRPMLIRGKNIIFGNVFSKPYPREFWVSQDLSNVYRNPLLEKQVRNILRLHGPVSAAFTRIGLVRDDWYVWSVMRGQYRDWYYQHVRTGKRFRTAMQCLRYLAELHKRTTRGAADDDVPALKDRFATLFGRRPRGTKANDPEWLRAKLAEAVPQNAGGESKQQQRTYHEPRVGDRVSTLWDVGKGVQLTMEFYSGRVVKVTSKTVAVKYDDDGSVFNHPRTFFSEKHFGKKWRFV